MEKLNLPYFGHKVKCSENREKIYDPIRKKYVRLTPEEWVRQNFIQYMILEKGYPAGRIGVEVSLKVNMLQKRADIIAYDSKALPVLLVECKAPSVAITQDTFDQAARYNLKLGVDFFVCTNGLTHIFAVYDTQNNCYGYLREMPDYSSL